MKGDGTPKQFGPMQQQFDRRLTQEQLIRLRDYLDRLDDEIDSAEAREVCRIAGRLIILGGRPS